MLKQCDYFVFQLIYKRLVTNICRYVTGDLLWIENKIVVSFYWKYHYLPNCLNVTLALYALTNIQVFV